jgi:proline racemase
MNAAPMNPSTSHPDADASFGATRVARDERHALAFPSFVDVVDSHTEGEPTRVVVDGWPQPAGVTMAERRDDLRLHHDHLRQAIVREPRGHDAVVGALLTPPVSEGAVAGVVFFNNRTYLGMCGHGLIGVVRTLWHLGRIDAGSWRFDTPVGTASATLDASGAVTIQNVPAHCHAWDVTVEVPGVGRVTGDVAYGGNWFFLTHHDAVPLRLERAGELLHVTRAIHAALRDQGITGPDGAEIDHIELSGPPTRADADARNFVLCSGGEYDRSPCGTGTSAVMAVRHARGLLALGALWRQESITGSLFTGWLMRGDRGELVPHIRGTAYVTGEGRLRFDTRDPFRGGFADL